MILPTATDPATIAETNRHAHSVSVRMIVDAIRSTKIKKRKGKLAKAWKSYTLAMLNNS